MRINPITVNKAARTRSFRYTNISKSTSENILVSSFYYPQNIYFLGWATNLNSVVNNLDEDEFPSDIRQLAINELQQNSLDTLIDVHRKKYQGLEGCYSLDEAKKLYPEFKDVLSDKQVTYNKNSFMDKVKRGEIEEFNPDEDLALQFLKFYWGKGLSLKDLKSKTGNLSAYPVMMKLNIPTVSREYGHILKLSNPKYAQELAQEVAKKRRETMDRKTQKEKGLPVYIPKGPMSQEHKNHISQGLLLYYAKKRLMEGDYSETEEEKRYYTIDPKQRERIRKAMQYARNNTRQGESLKKHMKKFFAKNKAQYVEISDNIFEEKTVEQRELLKKFWQINKRAADQLSIAVTLGWEKLRNEEQAQKEKLETKTEIEQTSTVEQTPVVEQQTQNEEIKTIRIAPKAICDKVSQIIKQNGMESIVSSYNINLYNLAHQIKDEHKISFYNYCILECGDDISNDYQTILFITTLNIARNMKNKKVFALNKDPAFMKIWYKKLKKALLLATNTNKVNVDYLEKALIDFAEESYEAGYYEIFEYIENKFDKAYELYTKKDNSEYDMQQFKKFRGTLDI